MHADVCGEVLSLVLQEAVEKDEDQYPAHFRGFMETNELIG